MRNLLIKLFLKLLLKKYRVIHREISNETVREAQHDFASSEAIQKWWDVLQGDMIRQHIYAKGDRHAYYNGCLTMLRVIQEESNAMKNKMVKRKNIINKLKDIGKNKDAKSL